MHTKHNFSCRAHFCTVLSSRFVQIDCTFCEHGVTAELLPDYAPYSHLRETNSTRNMLLSLNF